MSGAGKAAATAAAAVTASGQIAGNSTAGRSVLLTPERTLDVQPANLVTMALGGMTAGSQHGRIDVIGGVLFEATSMLRLALIGGFGSQVGNRAALFLDAQAPISHVAGFYVPTLNPALQWDVPHPHTTAVLSVLGTVPGPVL